MQSIQTPINQLSLVSPDPERDAPFALSWFQSNYGKETLLLMGNPESKIKSPTLEGEKQIMQSFLALEKDNSQLTWVMRYGNETIGAVWLDLRDSEHIRSPTFNIMIGNKDFRGMGIGKAVAHEMIRYTKNILRSKSLHSRYLTGNVGSARLHESLGFTTDGPAYKDNDGLEFQNVKLEF